MSIHKWGTGVGAALVLVATGTWVMWPPGVDAGLWGEVRPVIEARLAADSRGSGYAETVPGLRARWFCRAEALELNEHDGVVRAGVNTLCMEYGVQDRSLVECSGGRYPQVVRLERRTDGTYRVVSREEPPDGDGYAEWTESHFGLLAESKAEDSISAHSLEAAARAYFDLPEDAPVSAC
ncbi:hypothetical protein [Streptomyces sp. NPDC046909]|uniref:hypothetical protein n=1 Tax=Streptomyces sp. NPDC046909 TaxID=3155617 RepID=UPI0033F36AC6